jgi:hypothetical protein
MMHFPQASCRLMKVVSAEVDMVSLEPTRFFEYGKAIGLLASVLYLYVDTENVHGSGYRSP